MRAIAIGLVALLATSGCRCGDDDEAPDGGPAGDDDDDTGTVVAPANVRIDGAEAAASDPESTGVRMCVTEAGEVLVAWSDDRDGVAAVWVRRSPDGGATWTEPPVRLGDPEAPAERPALACAGGGALIAWEDQREGDLLRPTVYVARTTDGGATWRPEAAIASTAGAFQQLEPSVAAEGDERAVVWYGDDNGSYDVFVARSSDGGASWGEAVRVDADAPGSAWSAHPVVGIRGDEVHVAWEDRRSGVSDAYAAASRDGGDTFEVDQRLDDGDAGSYAPALLVSAATAVDVAWHDGRDGDAYEVYLAHSDDRGRTFAEPVRLSTGEPPGTLDAVLPRLAAADDGVVHVVFYAASRGGYHVQHRTLTDGVPSAPTTVDRAPALALARYPVLAVSGSDVVVAWQDDRVTPEEGKADLYYSHSVDGGTTFGADRRIDDRPDGGLAPSDLVVAVQEGWLLAAWADARLGTADVWFARLPLTAP